MSKEKPEKTLTITPLRKILKQVSPLTRRSLVVCLSLFLFRRVLWLFTTPLSPAGVPRALLTVNCYLVFCYAELACLVLCGVSLWFDISRMIRSLDAGSAEQSGVGSSEDVRPLPEGSVWPPPPKINPTVNPKANPKANP